MSIKYMNAVWESDIAPVGKRMVLLALADNANDRGICKPGINHLTGKGGVPRSSTFKFLRQLEDEDGLIERVQRRRANGSQRSNAYRLNLGAILARKRVVTVEEVDELEALFDDEAQSSEAAGTPSGEHLRATAETAGQEQGLTAGPRISAGQAQGLTARPPQGLTGGPGRGLTVGPLEPPVEPPKNPPNPPQAGGTEDLPTPEAPAAPAAVTPPPADVCGPHRRRNCRECGLSPRVHAQEARAAVEAERDAREAAGRACGVCRPNGVTRDGETRWIVVQPGTQVPVTPYVVCRHDRTYAEVLADVEAAELAAERARATAARDSETPLAVAGREQARRIFQPRTAPTTAAKPRRRGTRTRTFVDDTRGASGVGEQAQERAS